MFLNSYNALFADGALSNSRFGFKQDDTCIRGLTFQEYNFVRKNALEVECNLVEKNELEIEICRNRYPTAIFVWSHFT